MILCLVKEAQCASLKYEVSTWNRRAPIFLYRIG